MLSSDLIRAARLDRELYAEAKEDVTATIRALGVVALVALAHGVGGIIRAVAFERDPPWRALSSECKASSSSGPWPHL